MKCPNCGEAEFKKTAKFCPECGQSLKKNVVHEAQAKDIEPSGKDLKEPSSHVESLQAERREAERKHSETTEQNDQQNTAPQAKPTAPTTVLNDPLQSCAADNSGDGNAGHVVQPPSSPNNSGQNQDTETCKDVREENVDEQANKQKNGVWYRKQDTDQGKKEKKQKQNPVKENKKLGKNTNAPERTDVLQLIDPEQGVTVVFQVLVSPSFLQDQEKGNVIIRAGGQDLGHWRLSCVDMHPVGVKTKDKDMLLYEGTLTLTIDRARSGVSYKYVLVHKGKAEYEALPEFPSLSCGDVNRFLRIPDKYLKANATWIQYDCVVHGKPGWIQSLKSYFSTDQMQKDRKNALLKMLPPWTGFVVGEHSEEMSPSEALEKFRNTVTCFTQVWVEEQGSPRRSKPSLNLDEVLLKYLEPRLQTMETKGKWESHTIQLMAALTMCCIFRTYKLQPSQTVNAAVLKCLALEGDVANKHCKEYEQVIREFPEFPSEIRKELAEGIVYLCNLLIDQQQFDGKCWPEWLCAVPLLHFLRSESLPFEDPDKGGSSRRLAWWGAEGLKITGFKQKVKGNSFFLQIWNNLKDLFYIDPLLKKTFLYTVPLVEFTKVGASGLFQLDDLCLALTNLIPEQSLSQMEWQPISEFLHALVILLQSPEGGKSNLVTGVSETTANIGCDLLEALLKKVVCTTSTDLICHGVSLVFATLWRLASVNQSGKESENRTGDGDGTDEQEIRQVKTFQSQKLGEVIQLLEKHLKSHLKPTFPSYRGQGITTELKVWTKLLSANANIQGFEEYTQRLSQMFRDRVSKVRENYIIEIFCEVKMESYHEIIVECFNTLAVEAVNKIIAKGEDANIAFEQLRHSSAQEDTQSTRYRKLLSLLLTKSWEGSTNDYNAVKHLLTWGPMTGYLKMFGETSGRTEFLTSDGRQILKDLQVLIQVTGSSIIDGSIDVEVLYLLKQHQKRFLDLWGVVTISMLTSNHNEKTTSVSSLARLMQMRFEELQEFQAEKEQVDIFLGMCEFVEPVNAARLRRQSQAGISKMKLNELCEIRSSEVAVVVKFFANVVHPKVKDAIKMLSDAKSSNVFCDIWKQQGKRAQNKRKTDKSTKDSLNAVDVVEQIWNPAYEQWVHLANGILDGSITLKEVDRFLGRFEEQPNEIERELRSMLRPFSTEMASSQLEKILCRRMTEIETYQQLRGCSSAAREICNFKKKMSLEGDFEAVEDLKEQMTPEFQNKTLASMDDRFLRAGKSLLHLSPKKVECLTAVVDSKELVQWLQSTIKSPKELKVLVDLALISAAESDVETDRISYLHTSCLGFASLIFGLEIGKSNHIGFDELMEACQPVWKAVEADEKLPEKLKLTSLHLRWLKDIKASYGSVAMTSLLQAEAINARGIYSIGRPSFIDDNDEFAKQGFSPKSVIKFVLPPEKKDEGAEQKIYTLDDLKDLQSKLMLIAGKAAQGKEEVDIFVRNLEAVMQLANVYISLCESGYVHRLNWSQDFDCAEDKVEGQQPLASELAAVSSEMEDCLEVWKQKIDEARTKFPELNHFTTQQLMALRMEIATTCHKEDCLIENFQVLALLESVLTDVDPKSLKSAIIQAFDGTTLLEEAVRADPLQAQISLKDHETRLPLIDDNSNLHSVRQLNREATGSIHIRTTTTSIKCAAPQPRREELVSFVELNGFSEKVALAGIVSCGESVDEDDLLFWCINNGENDEEVEELYKKAMQEETTLNAQNVLLDEEAAPAEISQETSQQCESVVAHDDEDKEEEEIGRFLTLKQLGSILRELSFNGRGFTPRSFPSFLKKGQPNLMLVPADDVFATVLALFMQGRNQCLPSSEEVLLCSATTSLEEIEILYRRATQDKQERFYCLVNADLLDYSVGEQAVEMLDVHTQGLAGRACEDYGLVFICSTENDSARIVAALDQYRVAAPACPSQDEVRKYLKGQLKTRPAQYGFVGQDKVSWTAAGALDREGLSLRVVTSSRGGLGKSLVVRRLSEQLGYLMNNNIITRMLSKQGEEIPLSVTVPLHGNTADTTATLDLLLPHTISSDLPLSRIFHIDVSPSVRQGLDTLLFNLVILGTLCDSKGRVWRKRNADLYIIEISGQELTEIEEHKKETMGPASMTSVKNRVDFYQFLPTTRCISPRQVEIILRSGTDAQKLSPLFDDRELQSDRFQRVFQYLDHVINGKSLDRFRFQPGSKMGEHLTCLSLLLQKCGIPDPSWAEILHFVNFLNNQLMDCEESIFCNMAIVGDALQGFKTFVVKFMLRMSQDFSLPSLNEENTRISVSDEERELERFQIQLRRRWEESPHPYIFFNNDHTSMTFFGFYINKAGHLVDPNKSKVLEENVMSRALRQGLQQNGVNFSAKSSSWTKEQKIQTICAVMGINQLKKVGDNWVPVQDVYDPDKTYELTSDNMKKILAIHMRFRCNIPVVIMGETGCGKTRLIRYMCALQSGPTRTRNMLLVKVHGGTTYKDIERKVRQAEELARKNKEKNVDTVLFFDEANTTEALDMIKEVMVDRRVRGIKIGEGQDRLQFIAACNPYRRHTDEMIQRLELAGLGYRVTADKTKDCIGHVPLRHLVYRVHALPGSMRPLIWDFGRLQHDTEKLYTRQIVWRFVAKERKIPGGETIINSIARVLSESQRYMREQKNECSFVSLRDVERTMKVMAWFYEHLEDLGPLMDKKVSEMNPKDESDDDDDGDDDDDNEDEELNTVKPLTRVTRALVLAIGVCYHAKLQELREDYRQKISAEFTSPCDLPGGHERVDLEISSCQRAVLDELKLGPNIARNMALSENVFMMVMCIELRIPLFVVGKPGSSKSLAKDVVNTNMQGAAAQSKLFRTFKEVHLASYQCSPLSTSEGIDATFRQCQKLQENKDLDKFVSVVVLDEVGLAEDSSRMPLKALHPLLEDGVLQSDDVIINTDEIPETRRIAFIGLSNWALDPAKMNRGIMLSRGVPGTEELVDSAMGICSTDESIQNCVAPLLRSLAEGYSKLYYEQREFETLKKHGKDEFFGLRDFYSLVKMVYSIAESSKQKPTWPELELAIRRNFGGLDKSDPVAIFGQFISEAQVSSASEIFSPLKLIRSSLSRRQTLTFKASRYLLILTENGAALRIIQQQVLKGEDDAVVIFGSRFPKDQDYTQVCRNINRIKICMETGRMVILLNLDELYESLYDALNQYYVELGGQKYVDLGLGSHRLKCRVHDDFRLIVIAEKEEVYKDFQIPMINRLEKHLLVTFTGLTKLQTNTKEKLEMWVKDFATVTNRPVQHAREFEVGDAFVGYKDDTVPAVVVQVWGDLKTESNQTVPIDEDWEDKTMERGKAMLLQCATPDAVARLPSTSLAGEASDIWEKYFCQQQHSSLASYLSYVLNHQDPVLEKRRKDGLLLQITTYSRLLAIQDMQDVSRSTGFKRPNVECITLQQFQTEQQFRVHLRRFLAHLGGASGILVVQCDSGEKNTKLIACARHILLEEKENTPDMLDMQATDPIHIAFIAQLPRIAGGAKSSVGFQGGKWITLHIDELRPPDDHIPKIDKLLRKPVSSLFDIDVIRDGTNVVGNTVALLRNCVQAAACRIDDEIGSVARATRRIELLLNLLPDTKEEQIMCLQNAGTLNFPVVLNNRIYQLLKERDERPGYQARDWIFSEALSGTTVHESGTFRKALYQRICNAVTPILAEVIALADRDCNLDLVRNDNSWRSRVWLTLLNNSSLVEIHYDDLISPEKHAIRERTPVLSSGSGTHIFQSGFPFSWIIKQNIDAKWKEASHSKSQSNEPMVNSLQRLIDGSDLGPCLDLFRNEPIASLAYLQDFVHMVYNSKTLEEHELVCGAIEASAIELGCEVDESGTVFLTVPMVHVAYSRIQKRLRYFSVLIRSEFEGKMLETLTKWTRSRQTQVNLDAVALQIYMELLLPSDEELQQSKTRFSWCKRILRIRQTADSMMGKTCFLEPTEDVATYGEKARQVITTCRFVWQRLCATRLFIEHVCQEDGDDQTSKMHSHTVLKLWRALDGETDFSTKRSLTVIERFLEQFGQTFQHQQRSISVPEYRRRCTAFFMELVSLFCFGESLPNPAEPEVMSTLMCYVTGVKAATSGRFSPFPDYSPVVKSFLLQQLLRSSTKDVKEQLTRFFEEGRTLQPNTQHILDVCVLFTQCMEDSLVNRYSQSRTSDLKLTSRIKFLQKTCEDATKTVLSEQEPGSDHLGVEALESVAKSRYVLSEVASFLNCCHMDNDPIWRDLDVREKLKDLFQSAEVLCSDETTPTPRMFLLMQLTKRFGMDCVKTLGQMDGLGWILPFRVRNEQRIEAIPDRFVVFGDEYRQVREAVAKSVLSGDTQDIITSLEGLQVNETLRNVLLMLSVYREVTMANASQQRGLDARVVENMSQIFEGRPSLTKEALEMIGKLLRNTQGSDFVGLQVLPGQTSLHRTLAEIVIHTAVVLLCVGGGTLLEPLRLLLVDPVRLVGSYFPTMPHDDFQTIIAAVHEAMQKERHYREGQWYQCRNGHRYFIGECGRPWVKFKCPEPGCGAQIGGESHQLTDTQGGITERENRTKTGHILGSPSERSSGTAPERAMSSLVTSIMRLLLHSSSVMAACLGHKVLEELISPGLQLEDIPLFFWQHLQRDLEILATSLGRSIDEAALTVHLVLKQMCTHYTDGATVNDLTLKTEEGRKNWEGAFSTALISPILAELEKRLQNGLSLILGDDRLGNDPLMSALYEFDHKAEDLTDGIRIASRSLWRYRSRVTLEHLSHTFQEVVVSNDANQHRLLQEFLKQEHKLRALQYLPDVVRLQRLLMDRFHRRMDRTEAKELSIRRFLQSLPRGAVKDEYEYLFKSFKAAWNLVRTFLDQHGRFTLEKEHCHAVIDKESPIAVLLPTTNGLGKCSTALAFYLVTMHNEFMAFYFNATGTDTSQVEHISVAEVTISQLLAYDIDRDLMPMVLSNCSYSLEIGKGTIVSYNWMGLERQIVDRLFVGRPFVDFKEESFAYRNDTRYDSVFISLKAKIPQESLASAVQKQIVKEVASLRNIHTVLFSLDLGIGFLASAGGDKEMLISTYLREILRMPKDRGLRSQKAEQHCQLKHILDLWRLMAMQRAKILTTNQQEPFEPMPKVFKVRPTVKEKANLGCALRKININVFLPELLELIELKIKHEDENVQDMEFAEYMQWHIDDRGAEEIPGLQDFPESICVKHTIAVWNLAVELSATWE